MRASGGAAMGVFGDIGKVIIGGALGGPGGAISVFTVEHGAEVVEGSIDVARQIVRVGTDVYRAAPPEVFALSGDPLHGLLKHEAEDELIMLGQIAGDAAIYSGITWPLVGPFGAAPHLYITGRLLLGKVHFRSPNAQEWEMARYIFGDTLPARTDVVLTNLAGLSGFPFTYPLTPLSRPITINLAGWYEPDPPIDEGPVLFHELTHAWQVERRVLKEVFLYDAHVLVTEGEEAYLFEPGSQWSDYNVEQQACIVEAWARGATRRAAELSDDTFKFDSNSRSKLALHSPLFRYINGNIRRADDDAHTSDGTSIRDLLADGGHRTVREMYSSPPPIWWP